MPKAPTAATTAVTSPAIAATQAEARPEARSPRRTTTGSPATRVETGQDPNGS